MSREVQSRGRLNLKNNYLGKFWISCLKDVVLYVDLTFGLKEDSKKKQLRSVMP